MALVFLKLSYLAGLLGTGIAWRCLHYPVACISWAGQRGPPLMMALPGPGISTSFPDPTSLSSLPRSPGCASSGRRGGAGQPGGHGRAALPPAACSAWNPSVPGDVAAPGRSRRRTERGHLPPPVWSQLPQPEARQGAAVLRQYRAERRGQARHGAGGRHAVPPGADGGGRGQLHLRVCHLPQGHQPGSHLAQSHRWAGGGAAAKWEGKRGNARAPPTGLFLGFSREIDLPCLRSSVSWPWFIKHLLFATGSSAGRRYSRQAASSRLSPYSVPSTMPGYRDEALRRTEVPLLLELRLQLRE